MLAAQGLAISSGDTASVGVGGLTLGGGIGWMTRAWGLAIDQLVGATVVTADGVTREVDANHDSDLFWALRGGGGGFGVVIAFEFIAHPLTSIVAINAPVTDTRATLRRARDMIASAPRDLTVTFMHVPAMDPSAPAGALLWGVWAGSAVDAAEAAMEPFLSAEVASYTPMAYPDVLMDMPEPDGPVPVFIGGNALMPTLTDALIDHLVSFQESRPSAMIFLRSLGGAAGEVPAGATAFSARDATWLVMMGAFDTGFDDAERADVAAACAALNADGALVYGNFSSDTGPAAAHAMYAPATAARLREIKQRWDPTNIFCRAPVFV